MVEITASGGSSIPKGQKPVPVHGRDRGEHGRKMKTGGRERDAWLPTGYRMSRTGHSRKTGIRNVTYGRDLLLCCHSARVPSWP